MNCKSALIISQKLADRTIEFAERTELDLHLEHCTVCRDLSDQSVEFTTAAFKWASEYTNASDPGRQFDHQILAAIAGRQPGAARVDRNRRIWMGATAGILVVLSILANGFIQLPVPLIDVSSFVQTLNRVTSDAELVTSSLLGKIPVGYVLNNAFILPMIVILNMIIYTKPIRRLLRAL